MEIKLTAVLLYQLFHQFPPLLNVQQHFPSPAILVQKKERKFATLTSCNFDYLNF